MGDDLESSDGNLHKADRVLREALASAADEEILSVVLRVHESTGLDADVLESHPGGGPVVRGIPEMSRPIAPKTMAQLESLSVQPRGGTISPLVIIRGVPSQIREALGLEGVREATLDESYDLITPKR